MSESPLAGVEALVFDVFGTVVDWHPYVMKELEQLDVKYGQAVQPQSGKNDWSGFAKEWRQGYITTTKQVAMGEKDGPLNVDVMHRQLLETMLASPRWAHLGPVLDEEERRNLNLVWHRLQGWPDSVEGLQQLRKHALLIALSNGNMRLLIDLAKHANLSFDGILSAELYNSFKPSPTVYNGALKHLSLASTPDKTAMVAAHIWDLRGAKAQGMRTVYVVRENEDAKEDKAVKTKAEGGEVDVVVKDLKELAKMF